jgi:hypothetical protein
MFSDYFSGDAIHVVNISTKERNSMLEKKPSRAKTILASKYFVSTLNGK